MFHWHENTFDILAPDIFLEFIGNLLWDEYIFTLFPTFGNNSGHDRNESLLANFIIPAIVSPEYNRKVIRIDSTLLDTYTGEYKINHEKVLMPDFAKRMRFRIFREGSKFFIKLPDGQIVKLFPESKDLFFGTFKGIGQVQIRIVRDQNGAIKHARRDIGFRSVLLDKVR